MKRCFTPRTIHQGSGNLKRNETPPHIYRDGSCKKTRKREALVRTRSTGHSRTVGTSTRSGAAAVGNGEAVRKEVNAVPHAVRGSRLGAGPKGLEEGPQTGICAPAFRTAASVISNRREELECPLTEEETNKMWSTRTTG